MLLQIRSNSFTVYRLFFLALFIVMSVASIAVVVLDSYAGYEIIKIADAVDKQAFYATAIAVGLIGFSVSGIMIFLMQERRGYSTDRRQRAQSVGFSERRSYSDRRAL